MRYKFKENKDQMVFSFKRRSWRNNFWVLCLSLIVLFFSSRAAYKVYLNVGESSKSAEEKQNELSQLEEREKFLTQEFKNLSTEDGREAKYREKFGLGRPGENVAIIVEGDGSNNASSTDNWWQSIKNFFTK